LANAVCSSVGEALARLPALRVVPCRSTAAAVAAALDDRALARLLAVRHVLTGSVAAQAGDRARLRLALVEARTGAQVWQLDEELASGELQTVPQRVAEAAARALGTAAAGAAERTIAAELYAKYLKARLLARQPSIDARRAAVRLLDEVVAAEPDYEPALLLRHSLRGWLLGNMEEARDVAALNAARAENVAETLALARRIVERDPNDLRGQWLLLADEIERGQWAAGFDRLDAMLASAGNDARLVRTAARLHLHAGYLARAEALALAAAGIDALDADAFEILALVAGMQRRDGAMREWTAIARQLGHEGMGRVEMIDAWRRRDWALLERTYAEWVGWGGKWSADWVPQWVRGVADPAQRAAAIAVLDGHDAATRQHFVSYFIEYALLGEYGRSLAAIRHHAKLPPATWMQGLWWPELEPVRRDPQFAQAMADLGFVALWDARGAPDLCERAADGRWRCR
jgi:TolB-like protein